MPQQPDWPSLPVGKLRHRGSIESPNAATPDGFGQPDLKWNLVRNVWASIDLITGREAALPDLLVSQVTHIISIRWSPTPVAAGMRACFGSHIYKIQAVENVQNRNLVLKLMALEINAVN